MTTLAWGSKVSPEFRGRVLQAAARLRIDPSWLMAIMYFESKLNPAAVNPLSNATGLIQFMPSTAADLNTTTAALAAMSAVEQLDYVERYFTRFAGKVATLSDAYMCVLWPRAVGQPEDYVLFAAPSAAYAQNRALDLNNDGKITKAEAASFPARRLAEGLQPGNATEEREARADDAPQPIKGHTMADAVDALAGIASIFNPAIGGAIGLAGQLFKSFAPALQEKTAKEINRHTDDPAIGTKIAADLATMLVSQAKVLTGKADDFQAVAAITQDPSQAESLAKLQASLDAHLDRLMKAGDKSTVWDQAMWAAQNVGRQTVSTIAIAEKQAGLYDMTRLLVWTGAITTTAGSAMLLIAIIVQSMSWVFVKEAKGIDPVLLALGGPLLTIAYSCWKDIISYRFDGSKAASDQTKALYQSLNDGSKA